MNQRTKGAIERVRRRHITTRLGEDARHLADEVEHLSERLRRKNKTPKPTPRSDGNREIRAKSDGSLDEVVVQRPKSFHLEAMGNGNWWMRVYTEDDRDVVVRFHATEDPFVEIDEVAESMDAESPNP